MSYSKYFIPQLLIFDKTKSLRFLLQLIFTTFSTFSKYHLKSRLLNPNPCNCKQKILIFILFSFLFNNLFSMFPYFKFSLQSTKKIQKKTSK